MSTISIDLPTDNYFVHIQPLQKLSFTKKVAIITNPKISGLHIAYLLERLEAQEIHIITVRDGEQYKNMQTIEWICEQLFGYQFDRQDTLIAFGGGVVGDMVGFVASIYLRGVEFIQIPTTLLSQVDSSVGGKTGVNNAFGKNLIGAFNQPSAVHIDTHFLTTLDKRELQAGIAEVIKMALCFDQEFFTWICENDLYDLSILPYAIEKSVQTKANVVIEDEKEQAVRAKLNYGHTFAHVIERQTAYKTYLHGEAVAMGMQMANELALKLGLISKSELELVEEQLRKYNLPTHYDISIVDEFFALFYLDKKTTQKKLKFILLNSIGDSVIKSDIDLSTIKETLQLFAKIQ